MGAVFGVDRHEMREVRGEDRIDLCIKNPEMAMLQPMTRQEQRLLVGLHVHGVLHLQVTRLKHTTIALYVLLGVVKVHRERGLRLREIGLLLPHLVIHDHVLILLPGLCLGNLHRQKKCYVYQVGT
jgi:hypothetical protein